MAESVYSATVYRPPRFDSKGHSSPEAALPAIASRSGRRIQRHPVRRLQKESGQTLPLIVLFMLSVIGVAGLTIDVGSFLQTKQATQAHADAAALAGAQGIADGQWSTYAAHNFGVNNKTTRVRQLLAHNVPCGERLGHRQGRAVRHPRTSVGSLVSHLCMRSRLPGPRFKVSTHSTAPTCRSRSSTTAFPRSARRWSSMAARVADRRPRTSARSSCRPPVDGRVMRLEGRSKLHADRQRQRVRQDHERNSSVRKRARRWMPGPDATGKGSGPTATTCSPTTRTRRFGRWPS